MLIWIAASILLVGSAWVAGFLYFVLQIPDIGDSSLDEGPTDAIIVLTGGSGRIENGLDLLQAGKAKKLFVSGVGAGVDLETLLSGLATDAARLRCCVVLGHAADDTTGNAAETAAWMRNEGYHSLRLVTANYHMPRSLVEFHAAMPDVRIIAQPVYPPNVHAADWWRWPGTAELLVREYMKYLAARLRAAAAMP